MYGVDEFIQNILYHMPQYAYIISASLALISVHILNNSLPYRSKKASFLVHAYLNEVILFYG